MQATYSVGSARSIEQAYERDLKSIHGLNHALAGFIKGVRRADVDNADELIGTERRHVTERQRVIQGRLDELYDDLLEVDEAAAHKLPPVPLNAAQIAQQRKLESRKDA